MRNALFFSLLLVLTMIGFSAFGFAVIPPDAKIATHWNFHGEIDGYSGRNAGLAALPAIAVLMSAIFAAVPYIDPRTENVAASRWLLFASWIAALALITAAHASIVLSAAGIAPADLPANVAICGVPAILIVVGNFVAKSRSNFFLGVRTPWTLSSEHAWRMANRAAGWMLVLTGLASIGAFALLGRSAGFLVILAGVTSSVLVSVAISYFAWRSDPERANP
jgi:uncharacterized membrane protein